MKRYIRSTMSIDDLNDFIDMLTDLCQFDRITNTTFRSPSGMIDVEVSCNCIKVTFGHRTQKFYNILPACECIDKASKQFHDDVFQNIYMIDPQDMLTPVASAISTKNLSKNLVRTKSSNIWSYGMDVTDKNMRFGNVIVQFKGKNGGPTGGTYIYYDVPTKLWQRWLGAASKGAFFWRYIRNVFKYSKLDGNKRGVLPNAIN